MEITVSFDLTPAQVQEAVRATATGLFAGWKQKLMDKATAPLGPRLAGATTVELSDTGLRITTVGGVQQLGWAEVAAVNERRYVWAMQHRPRGISIIPMSAVAPHERAAFADQLRAWVGAKYKVREGGMVAPSEVTA